MSIDTYPPQNVSAQTPTLAYAEMSSTQLGIPASGVLLNGLTATITVPEGRRIRITAVLTVLSSVADQNNYTGIREGATTLHYALVHHNQASNHFTIHNEWVGTPSAGSHTYTVFLGASGGTLDAVATADRRSYMVVEDITGSQLPVLPQSVPVGLLGQAEWLSTQAIVATAHTVLPLSVNVAVPAGRVLRISGRTYVSNTTASARSGLYVYEDGAQKHGGFVQRAFDGNTTVEVEAILSPSAGAHTYELRGAATVGTSTFAGDAVHPAFLTVEDITPTPAPGREPLGARWDTPRSRPTRPVSPLKLTSLVSR